MALIGLENGRVQMLRLNEKENLIPKLLLDIQVSTKRIAKIQLEKQGQFCHVISFDGFLRTIDLRNQVITQGWFKRDPSGQKSAEGFPLFRGYKGLPGC